MLTRYSDKLQSCEMHFGFKAHSSTAMCSMVLKIYHIMYVNNSSNVHCVLDATKAFDRVEYCKLFKLLLERDMPPHIIRVLINMHTGQQIRVL